VKVVAPLAVSEALPPVQIVAVLAVMVGDAVTVMVAVPDAVQLPALPIIV
jgi:hypothetical protein